MRNSIKLWGRKSSSNVQKVRFLLDELGLDYEHIDSELGFGEVSTSEVRALNPNGRVPVLRHGDVTVWESNAILRYLAATFGGEALWPSAPAARTQIDQWETWSNTTQIPAIIKVFLAVVRTPPSKQDPELISSLVATASKVLQILDGHLAKSTYVAGENFTIADIACSILMYRWFTIDIVRPDTPNIERWLELLRQRPAYKKWGEFSYEALRVTD